MSNIDKRALREAAEKATPGPWGIARNGKTITSNQSHPVAVITEDFHRMLANGKTGGDAEFISAVNPATVLALLDELEAAQSYAKERDEENQDLMLTIGRLRVERETSEAEMSDALCQLLPGVQYMDPPDGGSVTPLEQVSRMIADYREQLQAAEKQIAELEATQGKPVMFIDGDISPADAEKLAAVISEFNEETEPPAARMARIIRENPHPTNMCDMPAAGTAKGE